MYILFINLNWPVIGLVGIAVIVLLVLVNMRNSKDKRKMEQTLNSVDEKPELEKEDDSKL